MARTLTYVEAQLNVRSVALAVVRDGLDDRTQGSKKLIRSIAGWVEATPPFPPAKF